MAILLKDLTHANAFFVGRSCVAVVCVDKYTICFGLEPQAMHRDPGVGQFEPIIDEEAPILLWLGNRIDSFLGKARQLLCSAFAVEITTLARRVAPIDRDQWLFIF